MKAKDLRIPKPCGENWENFEGQGGVRHCQSCQRDVMDLTDWTEKQVDTLLSRPGERPCVRLRMTRAGVPLFVPERPSRVRKALPLLALAACTPTAKHTPKPQPEIEVVQPLTRPDPPLQEEIPDRQAQQELAEFSRLVKEIPQLPKLKGLPPPATVIEEVVIETNNSLVYPDLEERSHHYTMGKVSTRDWEPEELEKPGEIMVMGEMPYDPEANGEIK